jgi:Flp pilus assembly protein TadD
MGKSRAQIFRSRFMASAMALACAAALPACGSMSKMTTGSISRQSGKPLDKMSSAELSQASAAFGRAYEKNPKDKQAGLNHANALRMTGRNDQALAVMRQVAITHANDREVLAAYGKALAGAGEFDAALDAVRRAQRTDMPDWRLLSAEGAILDQMGQQDNARELYRKALDLQPNEPSVLSNLGMSYLLADDLKTAETYMRSAAQSAGADSRVRQNLALVVGLQGRFDEAEDIARQELSSDQAEANVAYLKSMLAQQNSWSKLKEKDAAAQSASAQ